MRFNALSGMLLGATLVAVALTGSPARAGVDIDFGANVRIGDDADLFFAVSSRYFDRDRRVVETWGRRYQHPDDLAVALFISKRSERSPEFIFSLRRQGMTWWDIGLRVGLPVDVWFVPVRRDPGPPYGKAYGHWKKHKHDRRATVVLSDGDLRNLVAVRMIHEYYGVPVEVAMDWRSSGRDLRVLVSEEYHRRHGRQGKPPGHTKSGPAGKPGKGHGKHK